MPVLLDDFESGPLAMAGSGTGKQGADGMDGLTIAANHPPDIALAQLQFEDGRLAAGNFREHHLIWIFDQLSNDELEEFFHVASGVDADGSGGAVGAGADSTGAGVAAAVAGTLDFLFFLSKLRTVSEG